MGYNENVRWTFLHKSGRDIDIEGSNGITDITHHDRGSYVRYTIDFYDEEGKQSEYGQGDPMEFVVSDGGDDAETYYGEIVGTHHSPARSLKVTLETERFSDHDNHFADVVSDDEGW